MIDQADTLAQAGASSQAQKLFEEAVNLALETRSSVSSDQVCRFGGLNNFAETVLPACDQAVDSASEKQKGQFQNSRGMVLALVGRTEEAIEAFETFRDWAKENNWSEQYRISRDNWIDKLRAGEQPFDAETLKGLRTEQ
jgi:hypothetical protein